VNPDRTSPRRSSPACWLVVGVLTCCSKRKTVLPSSTSIVFAVRSVLAILALIAGVLLVLGAVGVWP
jgi:hypothetical protein